MAKKTKTLIENTKEEFYSGLMVDVFDKITTESVYEKRATEVITRIEKYNPKAKTLLEVACGTGNFTKQLARAKFVITATDISKDEIEKARTKDIHATFSVADMSKLQASKKYDILCCFWESFRYLSSYNSCENTLKRIFKALNKNGLFFVDFTHFPPHDKPFKIPTYTIDLGNDLRVLKQTSILTKGDFDTRWDDIRYELKGKDVTGKKIEWHEKSVLLKPKLSRAPLLRITREKMEQMLTKAGFNILEIRYGFAGCPESMLFVAQKNRK
ncbi:class I SAM-dependent methyltransferase [archaeon]|nr:class I SAM-dependent methyltransferase [archaeon]